MIISFVAQARKTFSGVAYRGHRTYGSVLYHLFGRRRWL
jgi:hypothetical protein